MTVNSRTTYTINFRTLCFSSNSIVVLGKSHETSTDNVNAEVYLNEYDFLKSLSKKTISELESLDINSEEIEFIKNIEQAYAEHLKEYAKLSERELQNLGYSEEQINLFRDYEGSEEQIYALAASMTFDFYADYVRFNSSKNRTESRISYSYQWNGVPIFKTTDIVGLAWNNWLVVGSYANVRYEHIYGSQPGYYEYPSFSPDSNSAYGGSVKIQMTQQDNYYWAKSGEGILTLESAIYAGTDLTAFAKYGHSTVSIVPSISISKSPLGLTIDPSSVSIMGDKSIVGRCSNCN